MSRTDKPPYPGLRPFERDESHLFFGRDHCVDDMVKRLAERRFLAVLGSSGTGKSSLVRTGLFSALEMGLLPGASSRWLIVDFKPGANPLGNLARALLEAECVVTKKPAPSAVEVATLQQQLKQGGRRELIKWCREGHLAEGANLLVLVDQFEELFRYQNAEGREDAQALVTLLLESRWPRGLAFPQRAEIPIYVTITLRSEYLGACALIWGLPEAINEGTYLTPRMKREECEEAILGPARVCGVDVEPQLVTRLLNDMADFAPWEVEGGKDQLNRLARSADQLPLMQHALNQIWRRASERRKDDEEIVLKLADYRGLERELDSHAEEVRTRLDATGRATVERIFRAVTQGTTLANAVRRPTRYGPGVAGAGPQRPHVGESNEGGQSTDRLSQEGQLEETQSQAGEDNLIDICGGAQSRKAVADVLAAFGPRGCQFLTANPRPAGGQPADDDAWIDIAHESLIRQWKRLSGWLEKEGQAAREWQQLKEKAERNDWLRGRTLREAKRFRKKTQPTLAWTQRYGGEFDRVDRFFKKSIWRERGLIGLGCTFLTILLGFVAAGYYGRQQHNVAIQLFDLSVSSAQELLDKISKSVVQGGVTTRGAEELLQVAGHIAPNVTTPENPTPLIKLAQTASDIYGDMGKYDAALASAKQARDLAERLRAAKPNGNEVLQLLYDSIWRMADGIYFRSRMPPNDNEVLQLLYDSIWRMADAIYFRGGSADQAALKQSLEVYKEAQTIALRLMELSPDGAHGRALMFIYRKIGLVHHDLGNFDTAVAEFQTALTYGKGALDNEPNNRDSKDWKRELAVTRRALAKALAAKKDFDGAMEQFTTAVNDLALLAVEDRDNVVPRSNLASAHLEIGDFYRNQNKLDTAVTEYNQAIKIQTEIHSRDRSNTSWIVPLAKSHAAIGTALKQLGKLTEALAHFEEASRLRKQLANMDRASPSGQRNLATAYIQFADVATEVAKTKQGAERDERLGAAVEAYQSAIDDVFDIESPRNNDGVFDSYTKTGDIRMQQGELGKAYEAYRGASAIAESIAEKDESGVWQGRLVNSYEKIGDVRAAQNRAREATDQYQKALDTVTTLATKSQNTEWTSKAEQLNRKIQDLLTKPAQE